MALTIFPGFAFAQETTDAQANPLYNLPKVIPDKKNQATVKSEDKKVLLATDNGLYSVTNGKTLSPLWAEGKVKQIARVDKGWYFVTAKGILYTTDLRNFEQRNNGLPILTIKRYVDKKESFEKQVADIKDFCVNPMDQSEMVCATKDKVYLSRDAGLTWTYFGSQREGTSGIKAVAIFDTKKADGTKAKMIFVSHATMGFSYAYTDREKVKWIDIPGGLANADPQTSADEVSDVLPVVCKDAEGNLYTEVFISQTFIPRLYRFDFTKMRSVPLYKGTEPADTVDGLTLADNCVLFVGPQSVKAYDITKNEAPFVPEKFDSWKKSIEASSYPVNAMYIPQSDSGFKSGIVLNEAWLLQTGNTLNKFASKIQTQKSLYVPAYQGAQPNGPTRYRKLIKDHKLNALVIDMKDDYGLLRYQSKDSEVLKKAKTSQYAIKDLDAWIAGFKEDNVYLIARIVAFKDRNLTLYGNGKYAVWDKNRNRQWTGISGYEKQEDGSTKTYYYDEQWIDPYCPEVWEYDVAIAKELISRGFDEIQFDYIRFPTDGYNLKDATFRWRSPGMDKESALISFLKYARENIDAPIGIDIYGANGWYRTGARTGQDVETLAEYVDVICPMFYPSHFENRFLNYEPYEERPYRIYYYGTYRNTVIARNKVVVRPWIQTFFLNVPYDRTYYDAAYVSKEVFGVRDSVDRGYMHWNNAGNYSKLCVDPDGKKYTGRAYEAKPEFRKPAIGQKEELRQKENVSSSEEADNILVWDSVKNQDNDNL
ncbi:MAG: hypothetical protein MJ169_01055 [Treponema sp.]|nr:hypothetical protein [Treponema sp.]